MKFEFRMRGHFPEVVTSEVLVKKHQEELARLACIVLAMGKHMTLDLRTEEIEYTSGSCGSTWDNRGRAVGQNSVLTATVTD